MQISNEDVGRLLSFFNIMLYDIQEQMSQTQDIQEIDHYEERQEFLREWITRFSREWGQQAERAQDTAHRRSQGAKEGWEIRRANQGK